MKKIIVFDVDGTLLTSWGNLTKRLINTVRQVDMKQYQFSIATGRSPLASLFILEDLGINLPHISCGGACIMNHQSRKILYSEQIDRKLAIDLLDLSYSYSILGISFQNIDDIVADPPLYNWLKPFVDDIPIAKMGSIYNYDKKIYKIDVRGDKEVLLSLSKRIEEEIGAFTIFGKGTRNLDITKEGVNKGTALIRLSDFLGVGKKDIIVFGNGDNDIPMFEYAGCSVAMGNSPREVKEVADLVAPSNDEEGVAWAIDRVINRV